MQYILVNRLQLLKMAQRIGYYDSGMGILPFSGFPPKEVLEKLFNETKAKLVSHIGED